MSVGVTIRPAVLEYEQMSKVFEVAVELFVKVEAVVVPELYSWQRAKVTELASNDKTLTVYVAKH